MTRPVRPRWPWPWLFEGTAVHLGFQALVAARFDCCRRAGAGEDWRVAFAAVFGRSVDTFYERFGRERPVLIAATGRP